MPPKFALFLRKVVHRILPVREALGHKGLVGDVVCPVCRLEGESLCFLVVRRQGECGARASNLGLDFSVGNPVKA